MTSKVEMPKLVRRHSFSSLKEAEREVETVTQQQLRVAGSSRSDRKRSRSPQQAASEGNSPKKAALASEAAASSEEFLRLPRGR